MSELVIRRLVVPETLDAPDAADFIAMMHVRNVVIAEAQGPEGVTAPEEQLPRWQIQSSGSRYGFVAELAGDIVGRAFVEVPGEPEATDTFATIDVLAEHRRAGIGSALLDTIVQISRDNGKTVLQGIFECRPSEYSEQLTAPNGFGAVPLDDPGVAFAAARGFELAQVLRTSALELPFDEATIGVLEADAVGRYAEDFDLVRWVGVTPDEWLDDVATLRTRMTTDAPQGDLDITEADWDADRVRAADREWAAGGHECMTVAARSRRTGRLVGFTELMVAPGGRGVNQIDTLVLREARGRRLGMAMKIANLRWLAERLPGIPRVLTMNAEENVPMLDVNVAIGFRPIRYAGAWKLPLDAVPAR